MKLRPLSKEGEERFAELLRQRNHAESPQSELQLVTTLRFDPNLKHLTRRIPIAMEDSDEDVFFLSKLHHQRLKYGAKLLGWTFHVSHTEMVTKMLDAVADKTAPQRVRIALSAEGVMAVETNEVPSRDNLFSGLSVTPKKDEQDPYYEVVLDTQATPVAVTNLIKTNDRSEYDAIRLRTHATTCQLTPREAVLVGTNGELLEGSMTSIAVLNSHGDWITPRLANGGMVGVTRSFLLELGFVKEGMIYAKDLKNGDRVLVSNGVHGVCAGEIKM